MDMSYDDILKILKIIDESEYDEMRLETNDLKLHVRKHSEVASIAWSESQKVISAEGSLPEPAEEERSNGESGAQDASMEVSAENSPETMEDTEVEKPIVEEASGSDGLVEVKAPMLGTFYRAPSPGADPFVDVGDQVSADDTVCLIEVMKLFNSIPAGVSGRVSEILAEDGAMVEHEQPLIRIEPGEE